MGIRKCFEYFRPPTSQFRFEKSALRESNSPDQIGNLAPLPIGQGHICLIRKLEFGGRNAELSASHFRFPNSELEKRPVGVEPTLPPWQGSRLPLHHGCKMANRIVKDRTCVSFQDPIKPLDVRAFGNGSLKPSTNFSEHREGVEPSSPHYESGILATRRPVLVCF